jgi:dTDP-4-dehydrorhamnose 3,5-epimerase
VFVFDVEETALQGCVRILPVVREDSRGVFIKTFHVEVFRQLGLPTSFAEEYFSVSRRGVLRGLHFQTPPMDHEKIVCCAEGEVTDAVVDLRRSSPTYGKYALFHLKSSEGTMLYIPKGMAHGFYTRSSTALMLYQVTSVYAPACDAGIRWDTAGIPWDVEHPILSERDQSFPALADFVSPFA